MSQLQKEAGNAHKWDQAGVAWPKVSVLFVTYKRFDQLQRSFAAFLANTDYPNLELVITDDGSGPEIQAQIRTLAADKFALAPKNRGLGANNNAGMRLCTGQYILMVQDDCEFRGPREYLKNAISVLEANPKVGIVNFGGAPHPPDLDQRLAGSDEPCFVTPARLADPGKQRYLYTDQPHVRRAEVNALLGPYLEDHDMERCEREYIRRWQDQTQYLTADFPAYHNKVFFLDISGFAPSFRTTRLRYRIAAKLQGIKKFIPSPLIGLARWTVMFPIHCLERLRVIR